MKRLVTILVLLVAVQGWATNQTNYWIGVTNGEVSNNSSNWTLGYIPTNYKDTVVFDGTVYSNTSCVVTGTTLKCSSLVFTNGYTNTVSGVASLTGSFSISNFLVVSSAATLKEPDQIYGPSFFNLGGQASPFIISVTNFTLIGGWGIYGIKSNNVDLSSLMKCNVGQGTLSTTCIMPATSYGIYTINSTTNSIASSFFWAVWNYGSIQNSSLLITNSSINGLYVLGQSSYPIKVTLIDSTVLGGNQDGLYGAGYQTFSNDTITLIRSSMGATNLSGSLYPQILGNYTLTNSSLIFYGIENSLAYYTPSTENTFGSTIFLGVSYTHSLKFSTKNPVIVPNTSSSMSLNGASSCGGLFVQNTFSTLGYQLTATSITNSGTLIASNSTILVDQALINAGSGVFSQMTSTVQFGTTTNTATCNVTNFYNVLCNTAGKSIALTNAATKVLGTFSSTGAAASNVTWTGGSTLTLSNKAYLYFTSPFIGFAGKDVEVWDATSGTNHIGTGDYFPR